MEFGLLGPIRVHDGDRDRSIIAPKQRIVLAVLLSRAGAIASIDELTHAVWSGTPPAGAVMALRNHVMRLRQSIGPDGAARVRTRNPGYLIEVHDGELDLRTFMESRHRGVVAARAGRWEQARTELAYALSLWRGEPLLDVPSEWLRRRDGHRLAELRLDTLRERIDADLQLGEHDGLVGELNDLVREHPLREGFHAQLMLALYRSGRQAESLAAFGRARSVLVENVGVEPGEQLSLLHRRILTVDPTLQARRPTIAVSVAVRSRRATPRRPARRRDAVREH